MNGTCRGRQRGAALLVAMLVLTLVSTLAAGMVWQQWRAVQVEGAERARAQAAWVLTGALDWGRLILRTDAAGGNGIDHLDEPWANKLEEIGLATFLAADKDNNLGGGPEAYLSGQIVDAQSRYNLRNLVQQGKIVEPELAVLKRLCESAQVPSAVAELIASGLLAASQASHSAGVIETGALPLAPKKLQHLAWLGVDADSIQRLTPFVDLLPVATPVNLNTASREVLAAVFEGLDASSAERMVQARQREHFKSIDGARTYIGENAPIEPTRVAVASRYFYISGRLRLEGRVLEERALVERMGQDVAAIARERRSLHTTSP